MSPGLFFHMPSSTGNRITSILIDLSSVRSINWIIIFSGDTSAGSTFYGPQKNKKNQLVLSKQRSFVFSSRTTYHEWNENQAQPQHFTANGANYSATLFQPEKSAPLTEVWIVLLIPRDKPYFICLENKKINKTNTQLDW